MRIVGNHYVLICASDLTVKNIIDDDSIDTIKKFFEVLRNMDIKYEEIVPKSLDGMKYMKAE
jgi:hypothetical protein